MARRKGKSFAEKHGTNIKPDSRIKAAVLAHEINGEISCAVAFKIAKDLNISADLVGTTVDLLNIKLIKCQIGLFGYRPHKNIVKPRARVNPDIKDAILNALIDNKLSCKSAWQIASRFNISKMTVCGACEALEVQIKPCQLGAF